MRLKVLVIVVGKKMMTASICRYLWCRWPRSPCFLERYCLCNCETPSWLQKSKNCGRRSKHILSFWSYCNTPLVLEYEACAKTHIADLSLIILYFQNSKLHSWTASLLSQCSERAKKPYKILSQIMPCRAQHWVRTLVWHLAIFIFYLLKLSS